MILTNFKDNFFQKANKEEILLNLLIFLAGLSIPFSYAFNSICFGVLFIYSFIWFDKTNYLLILKNGYYLQVLFVLYFLIQLIGVFYSRDLHAGFSYLTKNIVFFILPITFINLSKILNYKKIKLALYGIICGVVVILLSIYINIFIAIFNENLKFKSLLTHFVRVNFVKEGLVEIHPPYFGLLVVFSLMAIFSLNFSKNRIFNNIIKYSTAIYFLISLYGISSFMSIVILCLLFTVYVLYLIIHKQIKTLTLIFVPIILSTIFIGNLNFRGVLNKFSGESLLGRVEWIFFKGKGDTSRPENWQSVLLVVKDNPLIGIGSDGGMNYLQEHRSKTSESYKNKHNAHNQYLETLLRHGILGLLVYLIIIYILVLSAIKSRNIIFCSFIFVFIISSITESYLVRQIGLTFFTFYALLFSTFCSFNYYKKKTDNEKSISS